MQIRKRLLFSFFVSWLFSFSLASLFHSQYVVNQLVNIDIKVSLIERIGLTLDDWIGLLPTYGLIIAIALVLAFLVARLVVKKVPNYRMYIYAASGVTAFACVLLAIESIMHINIIAGARGWGFYLQLLAGGLGGFIFAKFK